jgi:hypothetical protein
MSKTPTAVKRLPGMSHPPGFFVDAPSKRQSWCCGLRVTVPVRPLNGNCSPGQLRRGLEREFIGTADWGGLSDVVTAIQPLGLLEGKDHHCPGHRTLDMLSAFDGYTFFGDPSR